MLCNAARVLIEKRRQVSWHSFLNLPRFIFDGVRTKRGRRWMSDERCCDRVLGEWLFKIFGRANGDKKGGKIFWGI